MLKVDVFIRKDRAFDRQSFERVTRKPLDVAPGARTFDRTTAAVGPGRSACVRGPYGVTIVAYDAQVTDRSELEALRTRVANQAASLAEAVTDGFDDFHMGAADYVVELSVPEGPSTGGGKQARQNLQLVPRRKGYAMVIAGTVDPVLSTAELRTFEHVAILHELRYQKPLEISGEEYTDFLKKADVVLNLARVRGKHVGPSPELLAQSKARRRVSMPILLIFVLVMLLAGIVVYRVALVLKH